MYQIKVFAPQVNGLDGIVKIKQSPKWQHCFVQFQSKDAMDKGTGALQSQNIRYEADLGYQRKGQKKRNLEVDDNREEWERLNDQVTPLWKMPYEDQLKRKQNAVEQQIKECTLFKQAEILPIIKSEIQEHYRTKCEFSIGRGLQGQVEIGFMLGDFHSGKRFVSDAQRCVHVNQYATKIVQHVKAFVQKSQLEPYDRNSNSGFWRQLIIRSQRSGEHMVIMMVSHCGLTQDTSQEKELFREHMSSMGITTLLWTVNGAMHDAFNADTQFEIMTGDGVVSDVLTNLAVDDYPEYQFSISPQAFFQSNAFTCDYLYKVIGDWIMESSQGKNKILIDACCGTGTIGIVLSSLPNVKKIYGIESCQPALEDAKKNAELNSIENVEYVCDTVENGLESLMQAIELSDNDELYLILDPPRAGVHKKVIKAIKKCQKINQVIYVSCNPKAAFQNWVDFCSPIQSLSKSNRPKEGDPLLFKMQKAQAVDMFPQTEHCELVLQFNRV